MSATTAKVKSELTSKEFTKRTTKEATLVERKTYTKPWNSERE